MNLLISSGLALALAISAADPLEPSLTPDQMREASAIFTETWSPFCPGRTLASCTSGKATAWRKEIRDWLSQGLTRQQIEARLQARVPGFELDTIPDSQGIQYGPWVLGGLFGISLLGLGIHYARAKTEGPSATPEDESAPERTGVDRRTLEAELQALEP